MRIKEDDNGRQGSGRVSDIHSGLLWGVLYYYLFLPPVVFMNQLLQEVGMPLVF